MPFLKKPKLFHNEYRELLNIIRICIMSYPILRIVSILGIYTMYYSTLKTDSYFKICNSDNEYPKNVIKNSLKKFTFIEFLFLGIA